MDDDKFERAVGALDEEGKDHRSLSDDEANELVQRGRKAAGIRVPKVGA